MCPSESSLRWIIQITCALTKLKEKISNDMKVSDLFPGFENSNQHQVNVVKQHNTELSPLNWPWRLQATLAVKSLRMPPTKWMGTLQLHNQDTTHAFHWILSRCFGRVNPFDYTTRGVKMCEHARLHQV